MKEQRDPWGRAFLLRDCLKAGMRANLMPNISGQAGASREELDFNILLAPMAPGLGLRRPSLARNTRNSRGWQGLGACPDRTVPLATARGA